jgi:S-adenosylmethionine:tRNA ribosyltransferase-isomerase
VPGFAATKRFVAKLYFSMHLEELHYELPLELIAQRPLECRDASRLLLLDRASGNLEDRRFAELPSLLRGDEVVVLNNARVLPARLFGRRAGVRSQVPSRATRREHLTGTVEVFLVKRLSDDTWETLVRPGRKMHTGERVHFGEGQLEGEITSRGAFGLRTIRFSSREGKPLAELFERLGHVPLPPYIQRADEPADRERYQTVFAKQSGAVAAPTAGLHFTPEILERIRNRGVEICELTLNVGLGTFQPIHEENLEDHKMHAESYEIPAGTVERISSARKAGRRILAVGTTVVRALENSALLAAKSGGSELLLPGKAEGEIFIIPGFTFHVVDQLLTNFHLPRSTLLALVCAFGGRENVLAAYAHAVRERYRFYSYGDCMLIR